MKQYKLVIYTQQGNFDLDIVSDAEHFEHAVAQALDEAGTVLLNLADGGTLVLTAINTVAIAVYEYEEEAAEDNEKPIDTPRVVEL
jgi:hypothetical protein